MKVAETNLLQIRVDLQDLIGSSHVSECPAELCGKLGLPDADLVLVEPDSEEAVSAVLKYANERRIAVIPSGNGQQLQMGEAPRAAVILLSSKRLTGIVDYSVGDLTVTVKAGTPYSELQAHLMEHGQFVPILPVTSAESTVGGLVATAAAGPERVLYGSWRDNVIGLRLAYPNGQIIRSGGKVMKNVAGYDMNKLFVGSNGTLAFITEVTFKLRPFPKHRELVKVKSADLQKLVDLAAQVLASELVPSALELVTDQEGGSAAYHLAIGSDDVKSAAAYQTERIKQMADAMGIGQQVLTETNEQVGAYWEAYRTEWKRSEANALLIRAGFPIPRMNDLLPAFEQEAEKNRVSLSYAVSIGVGTLRVRLRSDDRQALKQTALSLRNLAEANGGYLVIEDGEYGLKSEIGVWGTDPSAISYMRGIKNTVDPEGILSPGRFVGGI
ncbi:FAD-binding oxidoreductase [Effusibacillus dendaii]|uniref:Glycolate oxidase n=1 Tax=Effusibacillus dendaii TaxID=2743772 RepID=A0A7I8D9N8_9BACL|nr:FAD-binding oxidoreductase [Effusibacillus dendaii]BCJ86824.1 glycolate oxidase [Effusibacillus dendaii]